jgi:hypothetical protein
MSRVLVLAECACPLLGSPERLRGCWGNFWKFPGDCDDLPDDLVAKGPVRSKRRNRPTRCPTTVGG